MQARLAALGLSSLGRDESDTLAGLDAVISILKQLAGKHDRRSSHCGDEVATTTGPEMLAKQSIALLGPAAEGRDVRVMVTMPTEAAQSYELVTKLVKAGMNVMRVNCAHDSRREWQGMIANLRRATEELGMDCKVLMDLAGPKARTGKTSRSYRVLHWKTRKDVRGHTIVPGRIALVGNSSRNSNETASALPVPQRLLRALRTGDEVRVEDSRGKKRSLTVVEAHDGTWICTCGKSGYVLSGSKFQHMRDGEEIGAGHV